MFDSIKFLQWHFISSKRLWNSSSTTVFGFVSGLAFFLVWNSRSLIETTKSWVLFNWQAKQYAFAPIIATSSISFSNVGASIEVSNSFLSELLKVLMTTVLEFCLPISNFWLKVLANCLFFFRIFSIVFKKPSRFLIKSLFRIRFEVISCCYLALDISSASSLGLKDIRNKQVLRCIQNLEENVIESCIISNKTPCFFI